MTTAATELLSAAGGDMQAVIDTAQQAVVPHELDPDKPQAIVVPQGASLVSPDLNAWRLAPTRRTGTYLPATVDAFIAYVGRFHSESTTVWVHPDNGHIEAALDDHDQEFPGWAEHRVMLDLRKTPEWVFWTNKDGVGMSQEDFAEHIEAGLREIADPDGADMLEIAQYFHATVGATFRSSIRLQSGQQQLQYDEEVQAKAGRSGEKQVPTRITLVLAPFIGEEAVAVEASLRYRVRGGKLTLSYHLDRPETVVRATLDRIGERLGNEFEHVYTGSAPLRGEIPF